MPDPSTVNDQARMKTGMLFLFDDKGFLTEERDGVTVRDCPMDRVHIWSDGETVKMGETLFPGHGDMCIERLLERRPELGAAIVDGTRNDLFDSWRNDSPLSEAWINHTRFFEPEDVAAFYHGTSLGRVRSILENGIVPMPIEERVWTGFWSGRHKSVMDEVYVTCDMDWAESFAREAGKKALDSGAVIECDLSAISRDRFLTDLDYSTSGIGYSHENGHFGDVNEISACLSVWRRIGVKGSIPAEAVTAVHFPGPDGWERLSPEDARARLEDVAAEGRPVTQGP